MKLSSAQKLIIMIAVIAVFATAVFFLLIFPQFGRIADLDGQISAAEEDYSSAQLLLEKRQGSKSRSAETEMRLLALANEVPENPEMPALIIELQDTVNASGLEFLEIAPDDLEPGFSFSEKNMKDEDAEYWIVSTELRVVGSWQDFVDLLQRLRRITRQVRIVSFDAWYRCAANEPCSDTDEAKAAEIAGTEAFVAAEALDIDGYLEALDVDKEAEVDVLLMIEVYTMPPSQPMSEQIPAPASNPASAPVPVQ